MKFTLATAAAAVLMSATASQAADLAKKAPVAVDYVKVCDAYGAGFFYIPGTETCIKIGGYLRVQAVGGDDSYGASGNAYYGNFGDNRTSNDFQTMGRFALNVDARSMTEFGVLRSFGQANMSYYGDTGHTFEVDKAYIQFAGITAGYAASFWDFFMGYSTQFKYGGNGELDESRNLLAYTFGFGNGLSATLSIEDAYKTGRISDAGLYGGNQAPDIVGQIKLDQAWGSAQLSAVAHHNYGGQTSTSTTTYTTVASGNTGFPFFIPNAWTTTATTTTTVTPIDVDKWGYAVMAGIQFNLPMLGAGDKFAIQAAYGKGALAYVNDNIAKSATGSVNDFYADGSQSKAWSVYGGFKHVFSPSLAFNIDAGYTDLDQPAAQLDMTQWDVAANLVWTPVKNLDVSLGVEYRSTDFDTALPNMDGDGWVVGLRMQRNF
jgi:hypothetical protein